MGKFRNFISHITVHKKDVDSFVEGELAGMGRGNEDESE